MAHARNVGRIALLNSVPLRNIGWAVAILAVALSPKLFSQSPKDDPRAEAWDRVQRTFPEFLTWAGPADIYPCGEAHAAPAMDFTATLHFNPIAAQRLCGTLAAPGSTNMFRGAKGWKQEPEIRPFDKDSVLAGAFWYPLPRTKDPSLGSPMEIKVRVKGTTDVVQTRKLRILVSEKIRAGSAACPATDVSGIPAQPGVEDVRLDQFYWVRLKAGEFYQTSGCGDFAILVSFHLVHKVEGKGWLWSTFWWDDSHAAPFGPAPAGFAWPDYAMDAAYSEPDRVIYNPWRDAEIGNQNCATCHRTLATYGSAPNPTLSFDMVITALAHFQ